jgi:hypothetical protein
MKRAAAMLALVCIWLVIASPTAARAQSSGDETLYIFIALRAGLNDGIEMCSDHDFANATEALDFARALTPPLGLGPMRAEWDPSDQDCVDLAPPHPLSKVGPRPHERSFHFDPAPVRAVAAQTFTLPRAEVEICTPELPTRVISPLDVTTYSDDCDRPFQRTYDFYLADVSESIDVSFRATPTSMLRGLLGALLFWGIIAGLLTLMWRLLTKREWRLFVKHRIIAWTLDTVLLLLILFAAIFIVPYWTSWVPSVQMYLHVGVPGEGVLVFVPALVLIAFMTRGLARQVQLVRRPTMMPSQLQPAPATGLPTLAVPDWWGKEGGQSQPPDRH